MSHSNQFMMPIKWRLKSVMAAREMSYTDLAEKTGLHKGTVNRLVNTYEMPKRLDRETLNKFCTVLKCQPGDLLIFEAENKE